MANRYIEVRGARENNLRDISVRIPKDAITVFTGVSGSGKSSLVFDTLAAEAQRQLNETFSTFIRNRLPKVDQPDADAIENLSTALVVNQKRIGGNSRSTVGTITDISSLLRLLYSRAGRPWIGYSNVFSFNDPEGMCPACHGIGRTVAVDPDRLLDRGKSLDEGAILHPGFSVGGYRWSLFAGSGLFDPAKPIADYSQNELDALLYGKPGKIELRALGGRVQRDEFEGLIPAFDRLYVNTESGAASERKQATLQRFATVAPCTVCGGARLSPKTLSCTIDGRNIAEWAAMEVRDLIGVVDAVKDPVGAPMVHAAVQRLTHLVDIGLGYLSLDRETATLSGGESQRIKMVRHLGSSLTDVMYVFDEPTIGLHPRDVQRMTGLLRQLRDKGNTILVVEHDPDVIEIADHVIDLGPAAGTKGGRIVFEGPVAALRTASTLTGKAMATRLPIKSEVRAPNGWVPVRDADLHNLKNVSVDIPLGVLTVVTGVAGSGKSTLITDVFVPQHPDAIVIDQSAVGTSVRSNPATYTGIMDSIRKLFAQENGVKASLFSFNSGGACPNCKGLGFIETDLAFLEPIKTTCEVCGGQKFRPEVLAHTLRGKSIIEVLELTIEDALDVFDQDQEDIRIRLRAISEVGLDYLTLGQPLSSLSGGECQRIKLASELHKQGSITVMDEPTTGLHMSDIGRLLGIMNRLVDVGNSVVVIEHNLDVIGNADWIIDLGPEAGSGGGEVVFTGTPRDLLAARDSLTGEYLRKHHA